MNTKELLKANAARHQKAVVASLVSMPEAWRKACDWQAVKAAAESGEIAAHLNDLRRAEGNIIAGRLGFDKLSWSERSKAVRAYREAVLFAEWLARETKELREYEVKGA